MKKFSIGDRVEIDGKNTGYISAMNDISYNNKIQWLYDISFSDFSDISENRIMAYADRIMYTKNQKSLEGYLHSSSDTLNNKYNLELDNGQKINNCANEDYEYYCDIVEVQTKENYWEKGYRIGANIKPNGEKMYQVLLLGDKGVLWPDVKNNKIRKNISEANVRSSYVEAHYDESKPIKIYGVYFDKKDKDYDTNNNPSDPNHIYLNKPKTSNVLKYEIKDDSNRELDSSGNKVKNKTGIFVDIKTTTCQPVTSFHKSDQIKRSYTIIGLLILFIIHFCIYYFLKHGEETGKILYFVLFIIIIVLIPSFIFCVFLFVKPSLIISNKDDNKNIGTVIASLLLGIVLITIINLWIYWFNKNHANIDEEIYKNFSLLKFFNYNN